MRHPRNFLNLIALLILTFSFGLFAASHGESAVHATGSEGSDAGSPNVQPTAGDSADAMAALRDLSKPASHHENLDVLVGEWDASVTIWEYNGASPASMTATVHREWVLDGRFIQERVEAPMEIGSFRGIGFIGYNRLDGQYQLIWMENMSTEIMLERGSFNPESRVLTTVGNHRDPISSRLLATRSTLDLSDPDRHVYVAYTTGTDGREFKSFEGVLERVKKD